MIRIAKKTRKSSHEIIEKASAFFGKGGEGLEEKERNQCCIFFEGAGGHISVTVVDGDKQREVDVESREFEYSAKRFLESI